MLKDCKVNRIMTSINIKSNQRNDLLLKVKNLSLSFLQYKDRLQEFDLQVISNLNMTIHEGEIVAVIGGSGSGKSLLAHAILGTLPKNARIRGVLQYNGKTLSKNNQIKLRGKEIVMIPQSVTALDPLAKIEKQVQSVIKNNRKRKLQQEFFQKIGLPVKVGRKYPFELSGGMTRKVFASIAMLSEANLIIADEPTPGLDPNALEDSINYIQQLAAKNKGVMFITHDLNTALKLAHRIIVIQEGKTVDNVNVEHFTGDGEKLHNPYTRALWNALPQNKFYNIFSDKQYHYQTDKLPNQSLKIAGISFRYPNEKLLFKKVNLKVNSGEIVGIYGYSGSGKTTLAKVISGYLEPKEGQIIVNGNSTFTNTVHPVQLIWQHPEKAINPRWKMNKLLTESQINDKQLLHILNIKEEWLMRYPSELSCGELQRFCIARAFHQHTKYIIADEMTTMLDSITQAKIWHAVLHLIKQRNIGLITISHDTHLLSRLCDRVIHFEDLANI